MSLKYRPEIDGLRAIAVVAVILYHAKFPFGEGVALSGGFIGVDIFFVISGFLITSIILKELKEDDRFSFQRFYERRIRRIIPALFTVMLVSIPFAWRTMSPKALEEFSGSVIASLFFSSNFWFWQANSYTAEPSQLQPFLHTWTLSIEEQFYVIFPVILLLLWKYFRPLTLIVILVMSVASLTLAHIGSVAFVDTNFYLLPSRGWELLAGAIVATVMHDERSSGRDRRFAILNKILPTVGLILILGSIVLFDDTMRHPSLLTLAPIAGTAMIIWFAQTDGFVTRLLSARSFVAIGLISYSLYLWHFPVFAFSRIWLDQLSNGNKIVLIAISFALAAATYTIVEQPFRKSNLISRKSLYLSCGAVFLSLIAFLGLVFAGNLMPRRFAALQSMIDFSYDYDSDWREGTCFLEPETMQSDHVFQDCETRKFNESKPTLLLWGDSHAAHLFTGYDEVFGEEYNIVQRTSSLCAPIIGRDVKGRPGCKEINDGILDWIRQERPDKIVLTAAWSTSFAPEIGPTISKLQSLGASDIELVGPVPLWQKPLPEQLASYIQEHKVFPEYLEKGLRDYPFQINVDLSEIAHAKGISYQSPLSILCKEMACITRVGETPDSITQFDQGHLTRKGSIYLVSRFTND
jgi:peptidoglycan/LPS O-acetylase OafA/YrhL